LKNSARQNAEAGVSRTVVAVRPGSQAVSGFYTVRMGEVLFDTLPAQARKRLPRYPVPVVHLARLAVDERERGKRLGEELLVDALSRALRGSVEVPAFAVEVIAKNEAARAFYAKYGFRSLEDGDLHLFLSMRVVEAVLGVRRRG
jgi:ribosomal protein S18 acetylase RimI-like enzyme